MKKSLSLLTVLFSLSLCSSCSPSSNTSSVDSSSSAQTKINVYTRDGESGTREAFTEKLGISEAKNKNDLLVSGASQVTSNGDMMTKIKADTKGIGYASLDGITPTSGVKALKVEGVAPSEETVLDGTYKLQRNFVYAISKTQGSRSDAKWALIQSYVDFMTKTKEGIAAIKADGGIVKSEVSKAAVSYMDLISGENKPSWVTTLNLGSDGKIPASSTALNEKINFVGSTSVEKISKSVGTAWASYIGFSTDGDHQYHNHQGSGTAATSLESGEGDIGFTSRDLKDAEKEKVGTNGLICLDAVATIVNSSNNYVSDITIKQIRDIYFNQSKIDSYKGKDANGNSVDSLETQISYWEELSK